jgi:HTH-type transcriptional regulator / antitoxin HigA
MDEKRYGELLAQTLPAVIETLEEHERLLTIAEGLMDKGEALSIEERRLLKLLAFLIEVFESAEDDSEEDETEHRLPQPHETLQRLMEARNWDASALVDVFGNPRAAAEVLAGRKEITKGQAKQLGRLFEVSAKLFLKEGGGR